MLVFVISHVSSTYDLAALGLFHQSLGPHKHGYFHGPTSGLKGVSRLWTGT